MNKQTTSDKELDPQMQEVLETLLANDENITARAVARLHPAISAPSSITRSKMRSRLLAQYQARQSEYRRWRGRVGKQSSSDSAAMIEQRERRIAELELQSELLISSHLALIRAVGELGGFSKWAAFYEDYQEAREDLNTIGSVPDNIIAIQSDIGIHKSKKRRK